MSKILHKCLSMVLVIMLLASLTVTGTIHASADYKTGDGLAAYNLCVFDLGDRKIVCISGKFIVELTLDALIESLKENLYVWCTSDHNLPFIF